MASSTATAAAQSLPASIGRFETRRVLGQGGQGIVYLALDPQLGREVAVKTLTHRARDPQKLLNEARNAAQLEHPNIVGLFEIELKHTPPYVVYQYAPGQPLARWCGGGELMPVNRAVQIMTGVLDAMHYAHQRGILHRDLTPSNILVDDDDKARILDFGISIALNDSTGEHAVAGTPNYLAPEVLANKPASPQSDLFALAVVLHELLTGERLFRADSTMAVIYKIINERILPPSMSREGVDPALDAIVMRGLEKDPALRYESAGAMRDALQEYLAPQVQPPADTPRSEGELKGAISFLQRRMSRKPDFPAVSKHISEINQKADLRAASHVNDLASVILKDYGLTTKLLKVVNSAIYGQYGGSISTISRAVVILGLEQVRALALGIIIFEHMKSGEQASLLKDAACNSFLSAMMARELCATTHVKMHAEEAFVGAMFHRLGRHLAIYYFPEEYREVTALMENKGVEEAVAAREIFGADFAEFGIAIGQEWNLPDRLVNAMRPQRPGKVKLGQTPDQQIAQISAFANEIAEIAGTDPVNIDQKLKAVLERYSECVKIDTPKLKATVINAVAAVREYAGLIGVNLESTDRLRQVKRSMSDTPPPTTDADLAASIAAAAAAAAEPVAPPDETEAERGTRRHGFLTNAISELTTAIIERAPINDMFTMVLEALYRSMGFNHVLFLLRDPARKSYVTRFGFGDDIDVLKTRFEYKLSGDDDIFHQAVQKGRNAVVIDTGDDRYRDSIPEWCRVLTQPRSILIFAVIVNKICIGVIYADTSADQLRVNAQELQLLNTLVKQLTLGVRQR